MIRLLVVVACCWLPLQISIRPVQAGDLPRRTGSTASARIQLLAEKLVKHSGNPVLDVGKKGDWDERNCGCFTVTQVGGGLHLYYMGSGNKNSWRIGLATSGDGISWKRSDANPVLPQGPKGSWDGKQVSMPYVLNDHGKLSMWYTGSGKGGGFGLATSTGGVKWKRHGSTPVMRGIGGSTDPCVRKFGNQYVMWYVGKQGKSFRIFRATSRDGKAWNKDPRPVLPLGSKGDFDETSHAGPIVLKIDDSYYLFHLGGSKAGWKMGLAVSSDGLTWKKSPANPILDAGGKDDWDGGSILSLDVLFRKGRFHVWYAASPAADNTKPERNMAIRIGYATSHLAQTSTKSSKRSKSRKGRPASKRTYLLTCPGPNTNIELRLVDRKTVNEKLFVDITGLRVYAATALDRRNAYGRLLGKPSNHFYAQRFVTDSLSKLRSESGVEPDIVPINGKEGKKLGTKNMVLVKAGEFIRPGKYYISNYVMKPYPVKGDKYKVRVSQFHIDKYKVTNGEYCVFLNDGNAAYWTPWNPRIVRNRRGKFVPADRILENIHVVGVHWFQASGYAKWAGKKLPTEAQWEFAAGGPEGRKYPWGNDPPDKTRANFFGLLKYHTPGGAFPAGATPTGIFDLAGNSAEWIADYYDESYYRTAPKAARLIDPKGPPTGSPKHKFRRMFKGLCKGFKEPECLLVLKRHSRPPLLPATAGIGFRCVKPGCT